VHACLLDDFDRQTARCYGGPRTSTAPLLLSQAELVHQYGYERMAHTLSALHRLGLLRRQEGRNTWPSLKKVLQLVVDDMPELELGAEPSELAYTYSGYAPLSVRLVQWMVHPLWTSRRELLSPLPGPLFALDEGLPSAGATMEPSANADTAARHDKAASVPSPATKTPVVLVFFIGGCTFSEISALRWLRRNDTPRRDYIVASTHIANGDALMDSVIDTLENKLHDLD